MPDHIDTQTSPAEPERKRDVRRSSMPVQQAVTGLALSGDAATGAGNPIW